MNLQTMYPPQKDSPSTFLTGDITASDTLITVGNSAILPQTVPFPLTLGFDKSVTETVMVTAIGSGNNQLTVTRAAGSLAWTTGTRCARVFTATDLKTLQDNMVAVNNALNGIGQPAVLNLAELKAINTSGVLDKSMIFCESLGLYRFDSGSSATGDDYFVIVPTTGGGRWLILAEVTYGTTNRFASAGAIADANGNELIKFPAKVASAVNEVTISNNTTGNAPILQSSGNDTNVGMDIKTKGTGLFRVFVNGVVSFVSDVVAGAVNYLTFKSSVAGSAPTVNATGTDTNIDINLVPKGTGTVKANGVVVATTTGTQTLTNKTLSSPTIGDMTNAQHDHSSATKGGLIDHDSLTDKGTNTHAQIDTHIADTATPHGATSGATANKILIRDANGRAQVSDPSASADIATKAYVDARMDGVSNKTAVKVATTGNIALSGTQTIDGVAVVAGDRVLVKSQTTGSQNGIYVVAAGAWARATDADISAEVKSGLFTFVQSGTVNGSNGFTLTTPDPITLGTTSLTFIQTSGAGQITNGTGLTKSGNTLSLASGVSTPGTYKSVNVDTYGRVTEGSNPTTLAGYGITDALSTNGGELSGTLFAAGHGDYDVNRGGRSPAFEVRGNTAENGAAFMTFNRPNIFAANFGLNKNNEFVVGGFSMGDVMYKLWHSGNSNFLSKNEDYRPSILINDSFQIWQRGSSFTSPNGVYTADRWKIDNNADANVLVRSVTSYAPDIGLHIMQINATGAANAFTEISQIIENGCHAYGGETITVSAKVYCNMQNVQLLVTDGLQTVGSPVYGTGTHTPSVTFQPNSYGTLKVFLKIGRHGTSSNGGEAVVYYIKAEVNDRATRHIPRPYAEELAMCKRYYQKSCVGILCYALDASTICGMVTLPVSMRANPTVSLLVSTLDLRWSSHMGDTGGATLTGLALHVTTTSVSGMSELIMGGTGGHATTGQQYFIANNEAFAFDAEL